MSNPSEPAPASSPPPPARPKRDGQARARADLDAGRPDLARERLNGCLYTLHRRGAYREDAYVLLGETCFAMKDYARAGAAWLLTTRTGSDVDQALAAFYERYGREPAAVLHQLKPHAPSEQYPPPVQARLQALGYRYRPYRPRSNPHVLEEFEERPQGVRPVEAGCLVAGGVVFVLAVLYLIKWFL